MKKYSIEKSKAAILKPNSEFERRVILQYYLDNDIKINTIERNILEQTIAIEAENIGIIGCLLNNDTHLNTLRLAIGKKNTSNKLLATTCTKYLSEKSIDEAENFYMIDKDFDKMNAVELDVERVYNTIYYSV